MFRRNKDNHGQQNIFLSQLMSRTFPKTKCLTPKTNNRLSTWKYFFINTCGKKRPVCKKFISVLFQVGMRRIDVIKNKIVLNESLQDLRGKHLNRPNKISDSVWELAHEHCLLIPHKKGCRYGENSSLNYFCNADLTMATLFSLFKDYYISVTGDELDLASTTYSVHLNTHLNFAFKQPKPDICELCFEFEMKEKSSNGLTGNKTEEWVVHKKDVEIYNEKKKSILINCKNNPKTLVIEFDFAPNLPLPKLPNLEQFYKRLLWFWVFNVHIHTTDQSYYFHLLEGSSIKGPNSVCSFLDQVFEREVKSRKTEQIILFSDTCAGQNRNYCVMRYLVCKAKSLGVDIKHVFNVPGHSYNQCDRNFEKYFSTVKKREKIEVPLEYVDIIEKTGQDIVMRGKVLDFDSATKPLFEMPNNMDISKAVIMDYKSNGKSIVLSYTYNSLSIATFVMKKKNNVKDLAFTALPTIYKGIKPAKKKDILDLWKYMSDKGKAFYKTLFEVDEAKAKERKTEEGEAGDEKKNKWGSDSESDEDETSDLYY